MSFLRRDSPIPRETLEELYVREKRSMTDIATRLGCSVNKVVYWMNKYELVRRHPAEANYVKRNPKGDPFHIKQPETEDERELFSLVMGLYLGEGTKSKRDVRLGNSDPQIIRTFLRFLREICRVEEKRIFAWLNIFDDTNVEEALDFWIHVTGLPKSQFYKTTIRKSKGGTYNHKSKYGTLTVGISNVKLSSTVTEWYKNAIEKFGS